MHDKILHEKIIKGDVDMKDDGVIMASELQSFRDNIADSLRGFAIISVIIGHVMIWLHRSELISSYATTIIGLAYSFHMPLMFMISGYVHGLSNRWHDERGWLYHAKKNFISIYMPYLWFSYFGWAGSLLIFRGTNNPINYNMAFIGEFFTIPYEGFREYCFLCTLFQVKLIHTAFEYKSKSILPCSVFWIIIFLVMNHFYLSLPFYVHRFHFGMYFYIGYLMKKKNIISSERHLSSLKSAFIIALGLTIHFFIKMGNTARITSAMLTSLGLFSLFYSMKISPLLLVIAGIESMVVFIVHDYVIFSMTLFFKYTGIMSDFPLCASLLTFTLAVSVPLLIVKIYKNVKCLNWIEYIFYPGRFKAVHS